MNELWDACKAIVDGRDSGAAGFSYKLNQGGSQYGMDTAFADEPEFDESRMSMRIPLADGNRRDGMGDLLDVSGIVLERHRRNPQCLFDHGKHVYMPLGLAAEWDEVEDKWDISKYTVRIMPEQKKSDFNCFFYRGKGMQGVDRKKEYEHALFCEQIYHCAVIGMLRGGSIGYQVIRAKEIPPDYERGIPQGLYLQQILMLEGSLVVLPANMDTVTKMLSQRYICGKRPCPSFVKSLSPYRQPRKVQMGYEGKARDEGKLTPAQRLAQSIDRDARLLDRRTRRNRAEDEAVGEELEGRSQNPPSPPSGQPNRTTTPSPYSEKPSEAQPGASMKALRNKYRKASDYRDPSAEAVARIRRTQRAARAQAREQTEEHRRQMGESRNKPQTQSQGRPSTGHNASGDTQRGPTDKALTHKNRRTREERNERMAVDNAKKRPTVHNAPRPASPPANQNTGDQGSKASKISKRRQSQQARMEQARADQLKKRSEHAAQQAAAGQVAPSANQNVGGQGTKARDEGKLNRGQIAKRTAERINRRIGRRTQNLLDSAERNQDATANRSKNPPATSGNQPNRSSTPSPYGDNHRQAQPDVSSKNMRKRTKARKQESEQQRQARVAREYDQKYPEAPLSNELTDYGDEPANNQSAPSTLSTGTKSRDEGKLTPAQRFGQGIDRDGRGIDRAIREADAADNARHDVRTNRSKNPPARSGNQPNRSTTPSPYKEGHNEAQPNPSSKNIRTKYRKTKGLRRIIRKSKPGSSVMYVSEKELKACERMCMEKGVKFSYLGRHASGAGKIKMSGDDEQMDEVAKHFGKPTNFGRKKAIKSRSEGKDPSSETWHREYERSQQRRQRQAAEREMKPLRDAAAAAVNESKNPPARSGNQPNRSSTPSPYSDNPRQAQPNPSSKNMRKKKAVEREAAKRGARLGARVRATGQSQATQINAAMGLAGTRTGHRDDVRDTQNEAMRQTLQEGRKKKLRKKAASHEELDQKYPETAPGAPTHDRSWDEHNRRAGREGRPQPGNAALAHQRDTEEYEQGLQEAKAKKALIRLRRRIKDLIDQNG